MIKRYTFFVLLFAFISCTSQAQTSEPYIVKNARVHKVPSTIVPNQIYEIRVALPADYETAPDKEYPIIVVLDGQWNFTLTSDIAGKLAYDGMIPEAITVGITWGGEGDIPDLLRFRDFLRPEIPFLPMSGGAALFLESLTQELVPYVENNYRVNDKRVLLGVSLGGLFTSYAMVEKPGYFDGYIAIAGSYFADGLYLDGKLATMAGTKVLKDVRSYLSVGSLDGNEAHVETFNNAVKAANLKGFKHTYKVINDVGHAGVEGIAYTRGLQYVFERPFLKLSEAFLQQYAGQYEGGIPGYEPFPITVSIAGKGTLAIGDQYQMNYYQAETASRFYINGVDVDVEFTNGQMIINSQGTLQYFTRVAQ